MLVVALLVRALGPARLAQHLHQVGGGFLWLLGAYLLANLAYALPLGVVLPVGARPSKLGLVASRLAAVSVNAATPFLGVGGEPVRLLWLRPGRRRPGVAALLVDRSAFLVASALFLFVGALVALRLPLPRSIRLPLIAIAAVVLSLVLLLCLLQRRGGVAAPVARLAAVFSRRRAAELAAKARALDAEVRDLHVGRPIRFVAAVALHFAGRCFGGLEVLAATRVLHMGVGLGGTLVLATVPLVIDLAFSMVPSQVGVYEGTHAVLAGALGVDPAAGVALVVLQRLRQVIFVGAGFAILLLRRTPVSADEEAPLPAVSD